jgi:hypothetical protein
MIDEKTLSLIYEKLDRNEFDIQLHAEMDIIKQGYNWSKEFIIQCLKKGKIYAGNEIYPNIPERHKKYYCIHRYSVFPATKLILIAFLILENILIIHIQPLNKGSKEGKIYCNL